MIDAISTRVPMPQTNWWEKIGYVCHLPVVTITRLINYIYSNVC